MLNSSLFIQAPLPPLSRNSLPGGFASWFAFLKKTPGKITRNKKQTIFAKGIAHF